MQLIHGDCLEVLKTLPDESVDAVITDPPYGIRFMGKKWDYSIPSIEIWIEVLRVLKPGAHALVACGTRTQHRMAVNLEDAGFEIRDLIAWIYGSGFPKSLDIGKAVDKLYGNERKYLGESKYASKSSKSRPYGQGEKGAKDKRIVTKGDSPYEGWGTALKPAMELWTLCRKPLAEPSIVKNILKYGTGGLNINKCRVETLGCVAASKSKIGEKHWHRESVRDDVWQINPQGRFPANVIHDGSEEVTSLFPETVSGGGRKGENGKRVYVKSCSERLPLRACKDKLLYDKERDDYYLLTPVVSDSGNASRFFYCAKASPSERTKSNNHPTVKPIKLMEYLLELTTSAGGVIIDPFMGSGTTGIAAKNLGREFIGIEINQEYFDIAKQRIDNAQPPAQQELIM